MRGPKRCVYIYWAGAGSDLAFERVSAVAGIKKKKKRGTAGSPLEDKQADKHSFPGAISSIPYARSPLPHSKSGSLRVTDGLFSSHKHGTPLETAQPLSTVPLLQPTLPAAALRQKLAYAACEDIRPRDRSRPAPCGLK